MRIGLKAVFETLLQVSASKTNGGPGGKVNLGFRSKVG